MSDSQSESPGCVDLSKSISVVQVCPSIVCAGVPLYVCVAYGILYMKELAPTIIVRMGSRVRHWQPEWALHTCAVY